MHGFDIHTCIRAIKLLQVNVGANGYSVRVRKCVGDVLPSRGRAVQ